MKTDMELTDVHPAPDEAMRVHANVPRQQKEITVVFSDLSYKVEVSKKFTPASSSAAAAAHADEEAGAPQGNPQPGSSAGETFKVLLDGVSGTFEAGKCSAIMGPSGAGKSTLMDLLAYRKNMGIATGERLYGGEEWSNKLRQDVAYVEQTDVLLGPVTVYEMLMFTAMLKLRESSYSSRNEFVQACKKKAELVMEEMSLTHVRNTQIGSAAQRGISGGEAKRVNVGLSLLSEPRVIFADEPTSGLDSYTALLVVRVLRKLAIEGKTVVASIHQPSQDIVALFDDLCLLAGGRVAYFGPFDGTSELFPIPPPQTLRITTDGGRSHRQLAVQATLSEVLLDACSQPNAGPILSEKFNNTESAKRDKKTRDEYIASCRVLRANGSWTDGVDKELAEAPDTNKHENGGSGSDHQERWDEDKPNGFYSTLVTLFHFRGVCALFRDEEYMGGQIYMNIIFCLIFASMWPNLDLKTANDLQDRLGLVFFSAILPYFGTLTSATSLAR